MLIINILLILLFFIILLYEVNIIEGQQENNIQDTDFYNYDNLLTDYKTILNKINLSNLFGYNIKHLINKYNNLCEDKDKLLEDKDINEKINRYNNMNKSLNVINTEHKFNNLLRNINIQIDNDHGLNKKKYINNTNDNIKKPKLCSLVDIIYDENNNIPDSIISDITDEYGNCFVSNDSNNTFQKDCKNSCYLKQEELEVCNEYSIEDIDNCKDYSKIPGNLLNDIHIEKNGLYYNCSLIDNDKIGVVEYNETPCIPKNKICNKNNMGFLKKCEDHNVSMEFPCEDYNILENGKLYNCISDDTKFNEENNSYSCVKNIKEKFNKPCINKEIINYNECKQVYN